MRPQAIIIIACLFAVGIGLISIGPGSYRKVEEIQTLEAQTKALREDHPAYEHLAPATVSALLNANHDMLLIDARREEEFQVSRIPGSVHLDTADKIARYLEAAAPIPEIVVIYSASGIRAVELLEELPGQLPLNAANLAGGIFAWANESRPLVNAANEEVVHVHPESRFHGRFVLPELRFEIEDP